jgi:hypothetical protein
MLVAYKAVEAVAQLIVLGLVALYDHFVLLPIEQQRLDDWPARLINALIYAIFDLQRQSIADVRLDQTLFRFPMAAVGGGLTMSLAMIFGRVFTSSPSVIRTQAYAIIVITVIIALDNFGPFSLGSLIDFVLLVGCVAAAPLEVISKSRIAST